MIRSSLFVLAILGAATATAIAAVHVPASVIESSTANQTVVAKNSPFPVLGPIVVEECAKEDCSDIQN